MIKKDKKHEQKLLMLRAAYKEAESDLDRLAVINHWSSLDGLDWPDDDLPQK